MWDQGRRTIRMSQWYFEAEQREPQADTIPPDRSRLSQGTDLMLELRENDERGATVTGLREQIRAGARISRCLTMV